MSVEPSIVSLITFNSGMDDTEDALGLRLLYGALAAMGFLNVTNFVWDNFLMQFFIIVQIDCLRGSRFSSEDIWSKTSVSTAN